MISLTRAFLPRTAVIAPRIIAASGANRYLSMARDLAMKVCMLFASAVRSCKMNRLIREKVLHQYYELTISDEYLLPFLHFCQFYFHSEAHRRGVIGIYSFASKSSYMISTHLTDISNSFSNQSIYHRNELRKIDIFARKNMEII